jgi:hypothetical protein
MSNMTDTKINLKSLAGALQDCYDLSDKDLMKLGQHLIILGAEAAQEIIWSEEEK